VQGKQRRKKRDSPISVKKVTCKNPGFTEKGEKKEQGGESKPTAPTWWRGNRTPTILNEKEKTVHRTEWGGNHYWTMEKER